MIGHLSLVFDSRPISDKDELDFVIDLYKKTFHVYLKLIKTTILSPQTLTLLLQVMASVCDCVLKCPINSAIKKIDRESFTASNEENLRSLIADSVDKNLIGCLFECLLRSQLVDASLFRVIKQLFYNWTHRIEVIKAWITFSHSLTVKFIERVHGSVLTDLVLKLPDREITMKLHEEFIACAWYHVLFMIGRISSLKGDIFNEAVSGISFIIDLHSTSRTEGNTLIDIYGNWLFDAALNSDKRFDINASRNHSCIKGKSTACELLCNIFSANQRKNPISQVYLTRFYSAIQEGLQSDILTVMKIVLCSKKLFLSGLKGIWILVPSFLQSISHLLPDVSFEESMLPSGVKAKGLKKAALDMIGVFYSLCNQYPEMPMTTNIKIEAHRKIGDQLIGQYLHLIYQKDDVSGTHTASQSKTVSSIRPFLIETLLSCLAVENDLELLSQILNLLVAIVRDDALQSPGLPAIVIKSIQDQILTNQWSNDVVLLAFDALSMLCVHSELIMKSNRVCLLNHLIKNRDVCVNWL